MSAERGWGCVGPLPNPRRPLPADLPAGWAQRVSGEPPYSKLKAAQSENPVVDESGFLTIPWPESEHGLGLEVDVLLATATDPTIFEGRYPTADRIARAWIEVPGSVEYIDKNGDHGIRTFQDTDIQASLKAAKLRG